MHLHRRLVIRFSVLFERYLDLGQELEREFLAPGRFWQDFFRLNRNPQLPDDLPDPNS